MITIKEFASLCGCNAQTLRYYDKIDLLKPVKVDQWSGYRYYTKSQAIDFVKIKNLQAADFTIEEIKGLLTMEDARVYEAFDRKIAQQQEKLERIRKIQQSYLAEMNTMKNTINSFCDHLLERYNDPEMLQEFGMNAQGVDQLVEALRSLMLSRSSTSEGDTATVQVIINDQHFDGIEAVEKITAMIREEKMGDTVHLTANNEKKEPFRPAEGMETVWSIQGWSHVHEILDQIPTLEEEKQYTFLLRIHNKPMSETLSYPLFMLAAMLQKGYGSSVEMHCVVEHSDDGENHFVLLKKG